MIFYTDYVETVLKRTTTDNTDTLMQLIIVKEQLKKAELQIFRQLHVNISVEKNARLVEFEEVERYRQ